MSLKVKVEEEDAKTPPPIVRRLRQRPVKMTGTPFPIVKRGRVKNVLTRRSSVIGSDGSADVSSADTSVESQETSMELSSSGADISAESSFKESSPDTTLTTTDESMETQMQDLASEVKEIVDKVSEQVEAKFNDKANLDVTLGPKDMTIDNMDTPLVVVMKKKRGRPLGWRKSTHEAKKMAEKLANHFAAVDRRKEGSKDNISLVDAGTSTCDLDTTVDGTNLPFCVANMSISSPPVSSSLVPRIPRPANAFMIFGRENRKKVAAEFPNSTNKFISTKLGERWRELDEESKVPYKKMAKEALEEHRQRFPGYIYSPMEARLKKAAKRKLVEERKGSGLLTTTEGVDTIVEEDGSADDESNKENVNPKGSVENDATKSSDPRPALAPIDGTTPPKEGDTSREGDISSSSTESESFLVNPGPSTTCVRRPSTSKKEKERPKIKAINEIFVAPPGYENMEIDGLDKFVLYKNKLVPFREWMDAEGDIGRMNWNLYTIVPPQLLLPIVECINESDAEEAAYQAMMTAAGQEAAPVGDVIQNGDTVLVEDGFAYPVPSTSSGFDNCYNVGVMPCATQEPMASEATPMVNTDDVENDENDKRDDQVDTADGAVVTTYHGGDNYDDVAEGVALLTNLMRGGVPISSGDCGTTSASGVTSDD